MDIDLNTLDQKLDPLTEPAITYGPITISFPRRDVHLFSSADTHG